MKAAPMWFKRVGRKTMDAISTEWDILAPVRFQQITSRIDITFHHILMPTMLDMIEVSSKRSLLDAGCGVGILTAAMATLFKEVVGIDPSGKSIEIAKSITPSNVDLFTSSIESFSECTERKFDVIMANMVLMDAIDLKSFIEAASRLMHKDAFFIFSITHPAFWPRYYGYENEPWYNYLTEIFIEAPFAISRESTGNMVSTHVHRPISYYIETLSEAGLQVDGFREPFPKAEIERLYPSPWVNPRYLFVRCRPS